MLSGAFLRATTQRFLGPKPTSAKISQDLEFLSADPAVDWDDVLPPCIWISTGEHEILFDNVVTWANNLRKEIGSERVELEIGKDEVHVWQ